MKLLKWLSIGIITILAILIIAYVLLSYYYIPNYAKSKIPEIVEKNINKNVIVGDVKYRPFDMSIVINDLVLINYDKSPFTEIGEIVLDVAVLETISKQLLVVNKALVSNMNANIERLPNGDFNIKKLSTNNPPASPKKEKINIGKYKLLSNVITKNIEINQSSVKFTDNYKFNKQSVSLEHFKLTSVNYNLNDNFNFDSSFLLNGANVNLNGFITKNGKIDIFTNVKNLNLNIINQYITDYNAYGVISIDSHIVSNITTKETYISGEIISSPIPLKIFNKLLKEYNLVDDISGNIKLDGSFKFNYDGKPSGLYDGKLVLLEVPLETFNKQLNTLTNLSLNGILNLDSDIKLEYHNTIMISVFGNVNIHNIFARVQESDFLNIDSVKVDDIDYDNVKNILNIPKITLNYPDVIITKTFNDFSYNNIMKVSKEKDLSQPFTYNIKKVNLVNGFIIYNDKALYKPFKGILAGINGSIRNIKYEPREPIYVDLEGSLYGVSPFKYRAKIKKDLSYIKTDLKLKDLPMQFLSPYTIENYNYTIDGGLIDKAEFHYKKVNKKIVGTNVLTLKDVEIGKKYKVPGTKIVNLPLAVKVLEDHDGIITVDVPYTKTEKKQVLHTSDFIDDAIHGFIVNTLSSPLNFINDVFKDKVGDVKYTTKITFYIGDSSDLEVKKLDEVINKFKKSKRNVIEVSGMATHMDWEVVKNDAILHEVRKYSKIYDLEYDSNEYYKALLDLFHQKYPNEHESGMDGNTINYVESKLMVFFKDDNQFLNNLAYDRSRSIVKYLIKHGIPKSKIFIKNSRFIDENVIPYGIIKIVVN